MIGRRELPRNLVLLLSDMKGFTARTSRQTREENARMMALHDALLLPVLRGFGGRKVKGLGDALLAAFESPTDAVLCAMAMQDRLARWNARAEDDDRIEVRIALSQGEVRREKRELQGEALQLLLAAESLADAGEVVLTDAVYLSMNKSEAPTEVLAEQELPGGGRIRLRRALRGRDHRAPYGGRALLRLGKLPDPARALRLRVLVDGGLRFVRRNAIWSAAALLLVAAGVGERVQRAPRDPLQRAAEMLQVRQPLAALAELDQIASTQQANHPAVQVVRGKAEHALGQAGPAFADFAAAAQQDPRALDDGAVSALVDDLDAETFPLVWRRAVVKLLGEGVGRRSAPAVRRLLASPRAESRDRALEVLELAGAATDADRIAVAKADFSDPQVSCLGRKAAVRRLALVSDPQAEQLLASFNNGCGSAEARDVLRRRGRARLTAAR